MEKVEFLLIYSVVSLHKHDALKQFFFILSLLMTNLLHAQEIDFTGHCDSSGKTSYPPAVRLKHYPFNKAAEIRLVSFEGNFSITDSGKFKIQDPDPVLLDAPPPLRIQ